MAQIYKNISKNYLLLYCQIVIQNARYFTRYYDEFVDKRFEKNKYHTEVTIFVDL